MSKNSRVFAGAVLIFFGLSLTPAAASWREMDDGWWRNQRPQGAQGQCWIRDPNHHASNYRHNGERFLICRGRGLPSVSPNQGTPIRTGVDRGDHLQVGPLRCNKQNDSCT